MKLSCLAIFVFLLSLTGDSQTLIQQIPDSILLKESVSGLRQIYLNEIGDNAQIDHGVEYIRNGQKAIGFPYYESDSMLEGTVSYQGILYPDRKLYYNLVSDELIINNYEHNALIALASGKVVFFTAGNHVFVFFTATYSKGIVTNGFYEELFPGEHGFYARREKKLVIGTGSEETKYIQYNNYFIRFKNIYYPVDSKNSLLDVLKDSEDVLKKYIRANKLNFKKDLESSLLRTTIYYSQLKH